MLKVIAVIGFLLMMWGIIWGIFIPHFAWIAVLGMACIAPYMMKEED